MAIRNTWCFFQTPDVRRTGVGRASDGRRTVVRRPSDGGTPGHRVTGILGHRRQRLRKKIIKNKVCLKRLISSWRFKRSKNHQNRSYPRDFWTFRFFEKKRLLEADFRCDVDFNISKRLGFGGATILWMLSANRTRKNTPDAFIFSFLRPLAGG